MEGLSRSIGPCSCCSIGVTELLQFAVSLEPYLYLWMKGAQGIAWDAFHYVCAWTLVTPAPGDCSPLTNCLPTAGLVLSSPRLPWSLIHSWTCWVLILSSCSCSQPDVCTWVRTDRRIYVSCRSMSLLVSNSMLGILQIIGGSFNTFRPLSWRCMKFIVFRRCGPFHFELNAIGYMVHMSSCH